MWVQGAQGLWSSSIAFPGSGWEAEHPEWGPEPVEGSIEGSAQGWPHLALNWRRLLPSVLLGTFL